MLTHVATGYNGTIRTVEQLKAWSHWQNLDPEQQRRAMWLLEASHTAGQPLGIGEIFRSDATQFQGALARHIQVSAGMKHCCVYAGKYYQLRPNTAHMAFPGLSYHEATTKLKRAVAIDFTGNLAFLKANAARAGMKEFSQVNNEPWHAQPAELPNSRRYYVLATMDPLKPFKLPGMPTPAPVRVLAPNTLMRVGATTASVSDVKNFQHTCNMWGWRDRMGRTLLVDGDYGTKSAEACVAMQVALRIGVDGIYGNQSKTALQKFLDAMVALSK